MMTQHNILSTLLHATEFQTNVLGLETLLHGKKFNQPVENLALNTTFKLPDESMFIERQWSSLFLGFFLIGVLFIMFIMCWVFSLMNSSRDHSQDADSHVEEP